MMLFVRTHIHIHTHAHAHAQTHNFKLLHILVIVKMVHRCITLLLKKIHTYKLCGWVATPHHTTRMELRSSKSIHIHKLSGFPRFVYEYVTLCILYTIYVLHVLYKQISV